MNKQINFEDNIFILNTRIRAIGDLFLLDVDTDSFLEKTLDDLEFIDNTLTALLDTLNGNKRYIEREEQLHNLLETEHSLSNIVRTIISGDEVISINKFPAIQDRITRVWNNVLDRLKIIDNITNGADKVHAAEPLVGHDELSELLKDIV
jgi:hypothetical protein